MRNRVYPINRVIFGNRKRECDVCGFDYLTSELKNIPGSGLWVCAEDYNPNLALVPYFVSSSFTQILLGVGFNSGGGFGSPTLATYRELIAQGIASGEVMGSPRMGVITYPSGVVSTLLFGDARVAHMWFILPNGVAPTLAYGSPTIGLGGVSVLPTGMASTFIMGLPFVDQPLPGVFVNDTFTDTNDTLLQNHIGETGATWTKQGTNDVKIDSNNIYAINSICQYTASGTPTTAEYDIEADMTPLTGTAQILGLLARWASTTSYYRVGVKSSTKEWFIHKGSTQLTTYTHTAMSYGTTYHVKFQVRNASKKVFIDGVEITALTTTNNDITAAGLVGIGGTGSVSGTITTGPHYDNFQATNI